MDDDEMNRCTADVFRDFAMACRMERDRIALAGLAAADRHFDSQPEERIQAVALADLAIATARRSQP